MKKFYAKMARASSSRIFLGVACVLMAVVFMFKGGGYDIFRYLTASQNLCDMSTSDMETVTSGGNYIPEFYRFECNVFLGWYGSDDDGYYYILPTADETYMGCFVYNSQKDTADAIVEEYWAWLLDETEEEPSTFISGRGYVYEMGDTEKTYFKEYWESMGASASILGDLAYKTFVLMPLSEIVSSHAVFMFILAAVFIIIGLWMLLSFIFGTYKRQPKKYIGNYGISETELAGDLTYALHWKNIDIGNKYAMCYGADSYLIPYKQLLWTYVHVTKTTHRTYGIKTGTTYAYQVFFAMRDGKKYSVDVKTEQVGQDIVKEICQRAPHVIGGYHDDLAKMFTKNIQQLIGIVEEHKAELERGPQETANTEEGYEKPDSVSAEGFSMEGGTPADDGMSADDATSAGDSSDRTLGTSFADSYDGAFDRSDNPGLDKDTFGDTGSSTGFK